MIASLKTKESVRALELVRRLESAVKALSDLYLQNIYEKRDKEPGEFPRCVAL